MNQQQTALRLALETFQEIAYRLEGSRIWGGMEWNYSPLHPFKYLPLRDKAREAIQACQQALAAESKEHKAWLPYLCDRADGVKGHYAIARWNPDGYQEVWNLWSHRWSSASEESLSLEKAESLLAQITIPTRQAPEASK